ncbi:hypothetical protein DFH09DRAFT_968856 [Mycena vulgaris]|nr:hypothetical protein DFH09DRAFT_968856 [Mycena vulgaris]
MSATELRARIDEISANIWKTTLDIGRQQNELKLQENSRSILQRQLNAVLDPVARLPLEVSSMIFMECLPHQHRALPGAHSLPMLFLNICHAWSNIALSNPELWTTITTYFPCVEGFDELMGAWLQRARGHPLSIELRGPFDASIAAVLGRHAHQLRSLELHCGKVELELVVPMGPFPMLKTLIINGLDQESWLSVARTLKVLPHLAPNLVECDFQHFASVYDLFGHEKDEVILPNLHRLDIGPLGRDFFGYNQAILLHLSLPALQALSLQLANFSNGDLLSFLKRSAPPLQELALGTGYGALDINDLNDCLRLLPALTHLELWGANPDIVDGVLALLAEPPGTGLLPNLRSLELMDYHSQISPYEALLHALTVRSIRFYLRWLPSWSPRPEAGIRAELVKLKADGMDIDIQTKTGLRFI